MAKERPRRASAKGPMRESSVGSGSNPKSQEKSPGKKARLNGLSKLNPKGKAPAPDPTKKSK
jgi:hypothetical protein